jgi:hypothetical protein
MAHPPHGRIHCFCDLRYVRAFPIVHRAMFGHATCLFRSIGVTLAFVIPRVPGLVVNEQTPLLSATGWFNESIPAEFSRFPANFSFPGAIALQVDTNANFLPLTFKGLDAQVYDLDSYRLVGTGHINRTTFPAKKFISIKMPVNFTYVATNDSDLTCQSKLSLSYFLL